MSKQTIKGIVMFSDHVNHNMSTAKIYLMFDGDGRSEIQIHNDETHEVTVVGKNSPVVEEMAIAIRTTLEQVPLKPKEYPDIAQTS